MQITLITQEVYDNLLDIQKNFPKLTFQKEGFEYINKRELSEEENSKFLEVENILKNIVLGFSKFNNFKIRKSGEVCVRFQYNWTADSDKQELPFTGVGYLLLDELLNGFRESRKN